MHNFLRESRFQKQSYLLNLTFLYNPSVETAMCCHIQGRFPASCSGIQIDESTKPPSFLPTSCISSQMQVLSEWRESSWAPSLSYRLCLCFPKAVFLPDYLIPISLSLVTLLPPEHTQLLFTLSLTCAWSAKAMRDESLCFESITSQIIAYFIYKWHFILYY